mmetsp:Transcript_7456/g.19888  ORF Transcript_7456/g.19888 Transcript_7456/m.19888 type:complete len:198 (+) Transcript_7456:185-778(+)
MSLDPASVAQRRQKLNEEAYFSVLSSFVASGQSQITLLAKLRKELNISSEQHKPWVEELRKGGPAAKSAGLAAAPGANSNRPVRGITSRDRTQSVQQPQQQSRPKQSKRKADSAAQPYNPAEEGEMVGFRVEYYWDVNRVWQEGIITRFKDNMICITFNKGTAAEIHEWVKWEASEKLKMVMADREDLTGYRPVRPQ